MPLCPKCKIEVCYLVNVNQTIGYFDGEECTEVTTEEDKYYCPSCGELLFTSYIDARDFFRGATEEHKEKK